MAKLSNLLTLFGGRPSSQADIDIANNFSTVGRETFRKVVAALSKRSRFKSPFPGMLRQYFSPQAAPAIRARVRGPADPAPR